MAKRIRIGAVAYLNARPLVFGMEQGLGAERIELSYDVPAVLADRMRRGELDVGRAAPCTSKVNIFRWRC